MATAYTPVRVTVTTTPTLLLDTNKSRSAYVITNESTTATVYINDAPVGGTVSTSSYTHGLFPNNELVDEGDEMCWRGQVWAVVASGTASVMVREY
jgi:hypothetical protein